MRRSLTTVTLLLLFVLSISMISYRFVEADAADLFISGADAQLSFSMQPSPVLKEVGATIAWSVNAPNVTESMIYGLALLLPDDILTVFAGSAQVASEGASVVLTLDSAHIANRPISPDRVHFSGVDSAKGLGLAPLP